MPDQERDADPFWEWWEPQRVQEGQPVYAAQTQYWARSAWRAALASVQPDERWIAGYEAALAEVKDERDAAAANAFAAWWARFAVIYPLAKAEPKIEAAALLAWHAALASVQPEREAAAQVAEETTSSEPPAFVTGPMRFVVYKDGQIVLSCLKDDAAEILAEMVTALRRYAADESWEYQGHTGPSPDPPYWVWRGGDDAWPEQYAQRVLERLGERG